MRDDDKCKRAIAAYKRRFAIRSTDVVSATMGGGGYAYVKNETTGDVARFYVSLWQVRYIDLSKRA